MSRKTALVSGIVTFLMILYCGYESVTLEILTASEFFDVYINAAQKYIFHGMIFAVPLMYIFSWRYRQPEYAIRAKGKLVYLLTNKCIRDALLVSAFVMGVHILVVPIFGLEFDLGLWVLNLYVRWAIFFAQCWFVYYLVYTISNKLLFALLATTFLNLLFLSALLWYDFTVDPLVETSLYIFVWYECISCAIAYGALCIAIQRKSDYL